MEKKPLSSSPPEFYGMGRSKKEETDYRYCDVCDDEVEFFVESGAEVHPHIKDHKFRLFEGVCSDCHVNRSEKHLPCEGDYWDKHYSPEKETSTKDTTTNSDTISTKLVVDGTPTDSWEERFKRVFHRYKEENDSSVLTDFIAQERKEAYMDGHYQGEKDGRRDVVEFLTDKIHGYFEEESWMEMKQETLHNWLKQAFEATLNQE